MIDRELQQNHNDTHNAIEHEETRNLVGPLSESGGDFFADSRLPESGNHSQRFTTHDPLKAAQGLAVSPTTILVGILVSN